MNSALKTGYGWSVAQVWSACFKYKALSSNPSLTEKKKYIYIYIYIYIKLATKREESKVYSHFPVWLTK
jgi:hypothetical protein